ncbi:MAG: TetR/AcrR family transcriptional regulator [Thermodesulfobacteriota bacterium]|nr:TetR/AcrR family transcriptional regulator [Thermodesulfobacteriota bacterium]
MKNSTDNVTGPVEIPEKLKQRLYPAVLELFSDYDFHQVNIREISKRTGVSSGTIYKYFKSKENLIFTILDEQIAQISVLISYHTNGMADIKEIFRKVFWVTMDFYDHNPGVAVTAFITVPMRTWMQDGSYKKQYDLSILKQHVDLARNKGEIDPDISNRQVVDAYYMVCYRYIHNWYYAGMNYKLTEKLDEYFKLFWKIMMPVTG